MREEGIQGSGKESSVKGKENGKKPELPGRACAQNEELMGGRKVDATKQKERQNMGRGRICHGKE